jgi:hypothetical protein
MQAPNSRVYSDESDGSDRLTRWMASAVLGAIVRERGGATQREPVIARVEAGEPAVLLGCRRKRFDRSVCKMARDAQRAVGVRKVIAIDPGHGSNAVPSADQRARQARRDRGPARRCREDIVERVGGGEGADRALEGEAGIWVRDVHRRPAVDHPEPVEQRHGRILKQRLADAHQRCLEVEPEEIGNEQCCGDGRDRGALVGAGHGNAAIRVPAQPGPIERAQQSEGEGAEQQSGCTGARRPFQAALAQIGIIKSAACRSRLGDANQVGRAGGGSRGVLSRERADEARLDPAGEVLDKRHEQNAILSSDADVGTRCCSCPRDRE